MKIFSNPYLWVGAILGAGWYMKNRPDSKIAKVATSLKEGATSVIDEAGEFATDVVDTGVSTAKDVFGVFEAGDSDADIDASGFDGKSHEYTIEDHDTPAHFDGDSNTGTCGVDIEDTDSMIDPDQEGNDGSGFDGDGYMNFNDMDY